MSISTAPAVNCGARCCGENKKKHGIPLAFGRWNFFYERRRVVHKAAGTMVDFCPNSGYNKNGLVVDVCTEERKGLWNGWAICFMFVRCYLLPA